MNVTFACPNCKSYNREKISAETTSVSCRGCALQIDTPTKAIDGETLHRCIVCPSKELFIRKDFPQWLGILIVVVGFILSSIAWWDSRPLWAYAILFATAAIDVVLYLTVGEALVCYRCNAHYRGVANLDDHSGFNLETHEKFRQQAAREKEAAAGAAGRATGIRQ